MQKLAPRLVLVFFVFVSVFFVTVLPVSAHTVSKMSAKVVGPQIMCGHLQVYLHGASSATTKCLDRKGGPDIAPVPCDDNSLIIWADAYYTGWTICFKGYGATDMTSYCGPAPVGCLWNWNDQASSYAPGCSGGTFYSDIGQEGQQQHFYGHDPKNNFDGQNGRLPNDTLSSVFLPSACR
jgi:hypothetical protein